MFILSLSAHEENEDRHSLECFMKRSNNTLFKGQSHQSHSVQAQQKVLVDFFQNPM